jgi:hypothetical protein
MSAIQQSMINMISSKMTTCVDAFVNALADKYELDVDTIVELWNQSLPDKTLVREAQVSKNQKKKTASVDPSQLNSCPYIASSGKLRGIPCGKRCIGDWCPSHTPEKLEKEKAKREAKKAEKKESGSGSDSDKKKKKTEKKEEEPVKDVWVLIEPMMVSYELNTDHLAGKMKREALEPLTGNKFKPSAEFNKEGYPVKLKATEDGLLIKYEDKSETPKKRTIDKSELTKEWMHIYNFLIQLDP